MTSLPPDFLLPSYHRGKGPPLFYAYGRISLKELAAEHEISLTQLKAGFKQIYGETPYAYLRSYKMHCASQRLLGTDLQIGEIALELGYQNPSKFAQAFRAVVGCTPAQYRSGRKNK